MNTMRIFLLFSMILLSTVIFNPLALDFRSFCAVVSADKIPKYKKGFPPDLDERRAWYKKKNGEDWGGLEFRDPRGEKLILAPGDWKIEQHCGAGLGRISSSLADMDGPSLSSSFDSRKNFGLVVSPDGRDLYAFGMACIYHYDLAAGQADIIGTPYRTGHRDGPAEQALLGLTPSANRGQIAVDYNSGRVYFMSGVYKKDHRIRYVEKKGDGSHHVKTVPNFNKNLGRFLLVSHDGRHVYLVHHGRGTLINTVNPETGRVVSTKRVYAGKKNLVKLNWHTNVAMGTDGYIYIGSGGECGGNGMSLYRVDPETAKAVEILNTYRGPRGQMDTRKDREWFNKILSGEVTADGPVGNPYLFCRSTADISYCPRTGAIYYSGWDGYGIRRYLDGYLTTLISPAGDSSDPKRFQGLRPNLGNKGHGMCDFSYSSMSLGIAPDGDIYMNSQWSVMRIFRTDWPNSRKKSYEK